MKRGARLAVLFVVAVSPALASEVSAEKRLALFGRRAIVTTGVDIDRFRGRSIDIDSCPTRGFQGTTSSSQA
jgi:hypothetical protein